MLGFVQAKGEWLAAILNDLKRTSSSSLLVRRLYLLNTFSNQIHEFGIAIQILLLTRSLGNGLPIFEQLALFVLSECLVLNLSLFSLIFNQSSTAHADSVESFDAGFGVAVFQFVLTF